MSGEVGGGLVGSGNSGGCGGAGVGINLRDRGTRRGIVGNRPLGSEMLLAPMSRARRVPLPKLRQKRTRRPGSTTYDEDAFLRSVANAQGSRRIGPWSHFWSTLDQSPISRVRSPRGAKTTPDEHHPDSSRLTVLATLAITLTACQTTTTTTTTTPNRFEVADADHDKALSLNETNEYLVGEIFMTRDGNKDGKITRAEWRIVKDADNGGAIPLSGHQCRRHCHHGRGARLRPEEGNGKGGHAPPTATRMGSYLPKRSRPIREQGRTGPLILSRGRRRYLTRHLRRSAGVARPSIRNAAT